jgi:serine/threonine protein kinase
MRDSSLINSLHGQQLDEYLLRDMLGKGGMATVYLGFDIRLKRRAAIKVINTSLRGNPEYAARFEREARAIAQLKHPYIVGIYRYGEVEGLPYIAMEHIKGTNLAAVLATYRQQNELIPHPAISRIMRQVCQALDYAHKNAVIHRDIKPSNIMLDQEGNAILTDFGLVLLNDDTRGETLGTPQYMAPEQVISSAAAVPQSDLYSVGIILYEMLTASLPFDAEHPHDVTMMQLMEPPPSPRKRNPNLSLELEVVLLKALAKEAEHRYPNGAALIEALDQALQIRPVPAPGSTPGAGQSAPEAPLTVSKALPTEPEVQPKTRPATMSLYILNNVRALLADLADQLPQAGLTRFFVDVPTFKPVRQQLAQSKHKADMIERLLEYAEQTVQVDGLLALLEARYPDLYAKHQPYYELIRTGQGDLVGRNLGKYHIVEWLGRGGMADIYKAYQSGLARFVAIKVIYNYLADSEDFIERFEREAMAMARLHHANIVQVLDFDRDDDLHYMVLEFIDGPTLQAELDARSATAERFPLAEVVRIFEALTGAIDYAHGHGMIHRDLKPSNIMFTPNRRVVLTDFGIVRLKDAPHYTLTRIAMGTPAYMAPEQARGEPVDERSDIYSMGVMLYELATGRLPFDADNPVVIMLALEEDSWPRPTQVNPDLPPAVEQIILKAMHKNPAGRFQTAGELARSLQAAVQAPAPVPPPTLVKPGSRIKIADSTPPPPAPREPKERAETETLPIPPPPPRPRLRLRVVGTGQEIVAAGQEELVVGRTHKADAPDIDLGPYADLKAGISRRHCRLLYQDEHWFVEDLGSTNGTYLNQIKLTPNQPTPLDNGDIIRCGQIELELKIT